MLEKALIDKNKREYKLMPLSAKERYESFKVTFSSVFHRIPKKHITSYLEIKAETLSRITRPKVASKTSIDHPEGQCRLDTYLAGALCNIVKDNAVDDESPEIGTCNVRDGDTIGLRPKCWYKL